jgi:hypothetical protein
VVWPTEIRRINSAALSGTIDHPGPACPPS